jgi:proteasome accessory factor A
MGIETEHGLHNTKAQYLIESYLGIGGGYKSRLSGDAWLRNGARFYEDHDKAEYSTPEATNPLDCMIHYEAGKRILRLAAENLGRRTTQKLQIFANCTDGKGDTYGCHENYQMDRVPESEYRGRVAAAMIPFLVTRQIFTGAGKVGLEEQRTVFGLDWYSDRIMADFASLSQFFTGQRDDYEKQKQLLSEFFDRAKKSRIEGGIPFQLSQRADFLVTMLGEQTTYSRPIFNLRDEPLADSKKYRRMHVISGEANMSQVPTYLKVGTTAMVVGLIDEGHIAEPLIELFDPVKAMHSISRDQTRKWVVDTRNGTASAIDIQRMYLAMAKSRYQGQIDDGGVTDDVLARWEGTLDSLESDPMSLYKELDWVIKLGRILSIMDEEKIDWGHPRVRDLDLMYHSVCDGSLHRIWEDRGEVERIVGEDQIVHAIDNPPNDTRAKVRGYFVENRRDELESMDWDLIRTEKEMGLMPEPLDTKGY